MYFFSNSEVYLKYTSFHKKSRSINEVLLKYKQSTFLFFSVFILHLYFFLGSSLKVYFYWTSKIWSINEVKVSLKYTSYIVFSGRVFSTTFSFVIKCQFLLSCVLICARILQTSHEIARDNHTFWKSSLETTIFP